MSDPHMCLGESFITTYSDLKKDIEVPNAFRQKKKNVTSMLK